MYVNLESRTPYNRFIVRVIRARLIIQPAALIAYETELFFLSVKEKTTIFSGTIHPTDCDEHFCHQKYVLFLDKYVLAKSMKKQ